MVTFNVTENNSNSSSPTMVTAGQLITSGATTMITVVANASGQQTLLVHPTTIVSASPSRNIIPKQDEGSPKTDTSDMSLSEINDEQIDQNSGALVENTHFISVPEGTASRSYTSLTPVTPSLVSEADSVITNGIPHPTYVQYVDNISEQAIYTSNGEIAHSVYAVDDSSATLYSPSPGQYYHNGNPVSYSQVIRVSHNISQPTTEPQLINNGTYLFQQSVENDQSIIGTSSRDSSSSEVSYLVNNSTADNNSTSVTVVTSGNETDNPNSQTPSDTVSNVNLVNRIPPVTVQWLLENYETADGVSLPRSTLYYYYMHHCNEHQIDPVNAASFGKLIRSVFLGLRTRRLGTRGNSKYHYYGIRLKPSSTLNNITLAVNEENGNVPNRTTNGNNNQSQKRSRISKTEINEGCHSDQSYSTSAGQSESSSESQHQQFLGDPSSAVPELPDITFTLLPNDCSLEDVDTFKSIYREHCEMFLHAVENLEFSTIESLWREFWRCHDGLDDCEEERYLSKAKLYSLSKCIEVQEFVRFVDFKFYQNLVNVLVPDVLRPIPSSLTQSIRNFAKSLETWLSAAMVDCPREMIAIKSHTVNAFSQTLRRYTSLNHLAQAARAVLQNSTQINQMLADLNRVDFHTVQEQASWVSQCDTIVVKRLEEDFKQTLQQQNSLEGWANWLKSVVDEVLKPHVGRKSYIKAARQFLLKWSFYSSMVIRDLTLRSAASFGSFHLIRLLYDEYMFYIIEHLVAEATGEIPIAVMGDKGMNKLSEFIGFEAINNTNSCMSQREFIGNTSHSSEDEFNVNSSKRIKMS